MRTTPPRDDPKPLSTFRVLTARGIREWQAEDPDHAKEQHEDAFPEETVILISRGPIEQPTQHDREETTLPVIPPINRDDPPLFDKIASHEGHKVEVALYGDDRVGTVNAAVECLDCGAVIVDQDRYPEDDA